MASFNIYNAPNYEEFKEYVKTHIRQYLPQDFQNSIVDIRTIAHTDGTYEGLVINYSEGSNYHHPIINLNKAYAILIKNILPMEDMLHYMADYFSTSGISFTNDAMSTLINMESFDAIKQRIFIKVCDRKISSEYLSNKPHFDMLNLSATFHIKLDQSENALSSVPITNSRLKTWNISELDLFKVAIETCQNRSPLSVIPLNDLVGLPSEIPIYVCCGTQKLNDAAVLFYPDTLNHIAEEVKDNYYLLPSSIHELLAIPESSGIEPHELEDIVHHANRTVVESEDFLSDTVLYYDKENKILMTSKKHEQEISSKHKSMER